MRQHVWLPEALSELSAGVVADVVVVVDVVVAVAVVVGVVVAAAACFLCLRPIKIVYLCQFVWCVYSVIMRWLFLSTLKMSSFLVDKLKVHWSISMVSLVTVLAFAMSIGEMIELFQISSEVRIIELSQIRELL